MLVGTQNTPSKADPRPKESAQNFSKEPFHTALLSKAHPFFSKKKKKKKKIVRLIHEKSQFNLEQFPCLGLQKVSLMDKARPIKKYNTKTEMLFLQSLNLLSVLFKLESSFILI